MRRNPKRYTSIWRLVPLLRVVWLKGFHNFRRDNKIYDLWRRYVETRGKKFTTTIFVMQASLEDSMTFFVRRWNAGPNFIGRLSQQETQFQRCGRPKLCDTVCRMSCIEGRRFCFILSQKRCSSCVAGREARPSRAEWNSILREW